MPKKRLQPEEIIGTLRHADVLTRLAQGLTPAAATRAVWATPALPGVRRGTSPRGGLLRSASFASHALADNRPCQRTGLTREMVRDEDEALTRPGARRSQGSPYV